MIRQNSMSSGVPSLAMTFGRFVIAPNFGGMAEYLSGTGNICTTNSPRKTSRGAMERAVIVDRERVGKRTHGSLQDGGGRPSLDPASTRLLLKIATKKGSQKQLASVIIPCHNAGRWIAQTLRSVAAQTYPAYEVIVIDDASTDDSIVEIGRSGVPVTLLHVAAGNAAAARNAGIEAASGDWIALLDADDVWYPNYLARATKLLSYSDDVALMCTSRLDRAGGRAAGHPESVSLQAGTAAARFGHRAIL